MSNDKEFGLAVKDLKKVMEKLYTGLDESAASDAYDRINCIMNICQKIIEQKDKKIERYKKALGLYADTKKWGVTCSDDLPDFQDTDDNEELRNEDNERITIGGKTARQALSEVGSEE